jgi:hypothetical protein
MSVLGFSSSIYFAHITCYWKFFLLHYTQVLCQYRLYRADRVYLMCTPASSSSQSHIATDSQSVSLGVQPHLGLMTRYILLFDSYGLVFVGRPLWREDGSVFCAYCWSLPAHFFSGPGPLGLATILYCLRFGTFLFNASYDLQGHGGGIRPRLHTGYSFSVYKFRTDHTENNHEIAIQRVHWRADYCLPTSYNFRPIVASAYRGVLIEPLPSNALSKSVTI